MTGETGWAWSMTDPAKAASRATFCSLLTLIHRITVLLSLRRIRQGGLTARLRLFLKIPSPSVEFCHEESPRWFPPDF